MSVHMLTLQASVHPELEVPLTIPQSQWRSKNEVRDSRRRKPIRKMARKRAQQRWSALLARISRQVRLERSLWADFAAHANRLYKPAFIAAFEDAPVLAYVGPVGGSPCGFCVNLASSDAFTKLGLLHLDDEQDVVVTCDLWKRAMPSSPVAWDDGVDGGLLCHLLFSVTPNATRGPAMLRFRCGPGASRCHKLNMPHYETLVDVALTKPDEPSILEESVCTR